MRYPRRVVLMLLVPLLSMACAGRGAVQPVAPVVSPADMLRHTLDSIADAPPLHRTHWGVHVTDAADGRVLYSRNAERHFIPASNMKLVVGAVALARFGEAYRYRTSLLARGHAGDSAAAVIVVGSGDPTWSTRFHDRADAPLDSMAATVARAGVRAVGELIIDASLFTDAAVFGAWEVGDLPWQYAPPTGAVGLQDGTFRLIVTGAAMPGEPATVWVDGPVPQPVRVDVVTDTAGARATLRIDYTARRDTVYATGTVGASAADTSTLAVTRPAWSAAAALADAMRRHGIAVGNVRVVHDTADARALRADAHTIGELLSAPMADIVAAILRPSQNWMAEQVLKTLGAQFGDGGSWAGGVDVAEAYLYDVVRIDSGSVNLRDASGLSPQNLLTPEATTALLAHARVQPWALTWRDALAAPGMTGSTLASRLRSVDGRLFAKTGTIANVNALSGYLVTAGGRELMFSIMTNGSGLPAARVRAALDAMVLAVDRHADTAR